MGDLRRAGARIHYTVTGKGPPLLLLHGFTGSSAALGDLVRRLRADCTCIAPDLLGHGGSDSPDDPARYRLSALAEDALAVMDALGIGRFALFGYSLGGRVAMRLALGAQGRALALALESASPGIEDEAERKERRLQDDALADEIERRGIEWFADFWSSLPLFSTQAQLPDALRGRVRAGRLAQFPRGLAMSLRGAGAGCDADVWRDIPRLPARLLLLAGAEDAKYGAIARRIAGLHPSAQLEIVPGAGHAVHLERPEAVARSLRAFLSGQGARGDGGIESTGRNL